MLQIFTKTSVCLSVCQSCFNQISILHNDLSTFLIYLYNGDIVFSVRYELRPKKQSTICKQLRKTVKGMRYELKLKKQFTI